MNRLYETVEPSVINERMLVSATAEQGPKDEAKKIADKEGFKFANVLSLRLDFRNILRIENLWEFISLTKLQMDNNIIEKIEGLDSLVNLVWLDLSFNNIEVIEGLEKLTKLQDISLYNNRISKIENLDAQRDLQVFSIGNNEITDTKDILYLRGFPKLRTLNISNNPVCAEEKFRSYVVAFIPQLEFLDYQLLKNELKSAANEMFKDRIDEQIIMDKEKNQAEEIELQKEINLKLHKKAFVEYLNTSHLYEDLFVDDTDGNKLLQLPGVEELAGFHKEKFLMVCHQLFTFGLEEYEKRKTEEDMFWECINDAKKENKKAGMNAIAEYMKLKNELFQQLQNSKETKPSELKLQEFHMHVTNLWDTLMISEIQLVDQLEEVIKDFERNIQDHVTVFLENMQASIAELRELESVYQEKMLDFAVTVLDKVSKNEGETITEELKMLISDKDLILAAVSSSRDLHIFKLDNKEDSIITGINTWMNNLMQTIHQHVEIDRNRARVIEINNLIQFLQDELDEVEVVSEGDALQKEGVDVIF